MKQQPPTVLKKYIVTEDLRPLVEGWFTTKYGRPLTDGTIFRRLSARLDKALQHLAFFEKDGHDYKITLVRKRRGEQKHLVRRASDVRSFWIALDDIYVRGVDDRLQLQITRLFDCDGKKINIGLRPGQEGEYKSIDTKISQIRDAFNQAGQPADVVLADDGTYTGSTIKTVMSRLAQKGIVVTEVRLAFCTEEGRAELRTLEKKRVKTATGKTRYMSINCPELEEKAAIHDWVCERDFYLGVPRSGRTVGYLTGTGSDPVPLPPGISHPYVHGFGNVKDGAGIEVGRYDLGEMLISDSIELWEHLERAAGLPIPVEDLPRFPGPGTAEAAREYAKVRAVEYLQDVEKLLYGSNACKKRQVNRSAAVSAETLTGTPDGAAELA